MFCWFNKNSNFGTVEQMFSTFALLLAGVGLPVDTRVDDLDIVSRSQVFQNNKLHLTQKKIRYSSTEFWTLYSCYIRKKIKHSMLCAIGVYFGDIIDTFFPSPVFALKCKLSEHLLSLYNLQIIYIPNPYCTDITVMLTGH